MSKFDYLSFTGGYDDFAVNKEKFTKEEALEIYKSENEVYKNKVKFIAIGESFVRHRTGRNEDNEPCIGWWIEYQQCKRSCPVWVFHMTNSTNETFEGYEYIEFK